MAPFWERYITEYDDSLSAESYIDPIGTLIIWSAFGRQIFKNRVNSISNDVRNYTLNLFHHSLVRKLERDDEATLSASLRQKYQSKNALLFKQTCLIFLENLFVYSILQHERSEGVESAGVLGISNARRRWDNPGGNPELVFTHELNGQILIRQLSLGVSGRYKTPLMEIGFFDNSYQYHKPAFQQRWAEAERLIVGDKKSLLHKLEIEAYSYLKKSVAELRHGGKLQFRDAVPPKLTTAYSRAFASPRLVGAYARNFWLRQTELDRGAAGALLKVLEAAASEDSEAEEVIRLAMQLDLPPGDRATLEHVAKLEPFLSDCTLLFTLMVAERTHSIEGVIKHWAQFGRHGHRLPELANQIRDYVSLPAVKGSEAGRRLAELLQVASAGNLEQQSIALAEYHRRVMLSRGQLPWLVVDERGIIKVNARTLRRPEPESWPPGAWYNQYYLPQFRNFVLGLQGLSK